MCCVRMVSVELLGACHLDLCFPGSFSTFHVKRGWGGWNSGNLFGRVTWDVDLVFLMAD